MFLLYSSILSYFVEVSECRHVDAVHHQLDHIGGFVVVPEVASVLVRSEHTLTGERDVGDGATAYYLGEDEPDGLTGARQLTVTSEVQGVGAIIDHVRQQGFDAIVVKYLGVARLPIFVHNVGFLGC